MKFVRGFGQFWYDFIVGDDWKIAAAVVVSLAMAAATIPLGADGTIVTVIGGVLLLIAFVTALLIDVRPDRHSTP
jgi:hypothetical protein